MNFRPISGTGFAKASGGRERSVMSQRRLGPNRRAVKGERIDRLRGFGRLASAARVMAFGAILFGLPALSIAQIHTAHDHIPNFAANPTIRSATNGSWSSASSWTPARVPAPSDVVSVSHRITYDTTAGDVDVLGIQSGGRVEFATNVPTRLRVGTLLVLPNGTLEVGTLSNPIASGVTAEIIIKNKALNGTLDPDQYGTGLVAVDGVVTMHGSVKTPTFIRTATEPRAGNGTIALDRAATGWRVGDRVFLPDTRQVPTDQWFDSGYALQVEQRTIASISADGRTITLSSPLSFDHRGARDADGTPTVLSNGIRLLPHVGNLSRNIVIRSENPAGTRGHTLFTQRATVNISYVQFQDLGRTRAIPLNANSNHIGRYPVHIHHLWGPVNPSNSGYQFSLVGNAVSDSLKWPIAVHGSHFGLIKQNVVFGGSEWTGAGIAIEDGSETENLFEENFVANIRADGAPRESGPATNDGSTPGSAAECFWAAGFNNRFVNNVAASCRNTRQEIVSGPGFKFIVNPAPQSVRNPLFRGADMTDAAQTRVVTSQYQAIREFRGNEVYGLAADGLTAWQLGTDGYAIPNGIADTLIKDFRVWHTYEGAVYNYPAHRMTFEGLVYRIDPAVTTFWPSAVQCGDYRHITITIRGGSIHAGKVFGDCTDPLGTYWIENVDAVTREHAFQFDTPATPGTGAERPSTGVSVVLKNNVVRAWPGQPLRTIAMTHTLSKGNSQPNDKYEVFVFDYQGQVGNNFRSYFGVQSTQNLYGGVAPCSNTSARPEVGGITCAMTGTPPPPPPNSTPLPPAAPTNVRVVP
jgi:hypothetical protein